MSARKRKEAKRGKGQSARLFPKHTNDSFLLRAQLGTLEKVRRRILHYSAHDSFKKLVKGNCDPAILLCLLANSAEDGPGLDTWQARFGLEGPRELKSVIRRMRKCAGEFARLDKNGLLRLAAWPKFNSQFTPPEFLNHLSNIPAFLHGCADALDTAANNPRFKPRAHGFTNTALAQLVAYVQHCTGKPHDSEVSALVDAVRKSDSVHPFTADVLKTWRNEHAEYIRHAVQMFPPLFGR